MKIHISEWLESGACACVDQNKLLIAWGKRTWLKEPNEAKPCFYAPDFFLKSLNPWFTHVHHMYISTNTLLTDLRNYIDEEKICRAIPHWEPIHRDIFDNFFFDLQTYFTSKKIDKAVIYTCQNGLLNFHPKALAYSLHQLLEKQKKYATHTYGFWDFHEGVIGSTPEILFISREKNSIETMACAGTQKKMGNVKDLFHDEKLSYEHQCVIDGITTTLQPFGKIVLGNRTTIELPQMRHLATPIKLFPTKNIDYISLIQALHPTPALGAIPRNIGIPWLEERNLLLPRKRFGAPFGFIDSATNSSVCYVAIRNAQWEGDRVSVFAGCGVVPASILASEWEEVQLKIKATKETLF